MPTIFAGVTEAESLDLTGGYQFEANGAASGNAVIWVEPNSTSGTASGDFSGPSGQYKVTLNVLNESDGVATWALLVNGVQVGSFDGTGGSSTTGTPDSETFTVTLNDGDTVTVEGTANNGERARLDTIEISQLGAFNVGDNEAEDLDLAGGYTIENLNGASGGQVAVLPAPPGQATGTISGEFAGPSGAYDIATTFFNESDGEGFYEVLVNGVVVGSWTGTGGASGLGAPDTRAVSTSLETGDTITIRGTRGDGERGRIDVINIEESATLDVGVNEAEDLTLNNYIVETRSGASGGEIVRLPFTDGATGSVSGIFDGLSGIYSLTVNYLDETDGESTYSVLVNGVEQAFWVASGGGSPVGTPASETVQLTIQNGDTIEVVGVREGGESARIDSLDLIVVNTGPTATADAVSTLEDTAVNVAVLANDFDNEGDPFNLIEIDGNAVISGETVAVANGTVTFETNNTLTVTPDADFNGDITFSYTIEDATGSNSGPVTVTVDAVNDAPDAVGDTGSTLEDGSVNIDVLANDTDIENDTLSVTAIDGTPVALGGSVAVDNATIRLETNGTLTITPNANFAGEVVFDYTMSDGSAADTATVAVTIGSVNDGLVAVADTAIINEDATANLDVTANDIDPDGDTLTVTEIDGTAVTTGQTVDVGSANVTLETDGTLSVTPDENFNGEVAFEYTVSDGDITDDGDVTVVVSPVNDVPDAADDSATVAEDGSTTINVLGNDDDGDGDTLSVTAIGGQAVMAGGSVDVGNARVTLESNGALTVTPDPDFDGEVTFEYTISDGFSTDTAEVSVAVTGVNDAPNASDDTASTQEDAPVTVDVLANDIDPEGDTLTITAIAGTAVTAGSTVDVGDATVTLGAGGSLSVAPDTGFDGDITFDYTVSDGSLSDTASATIAVAGVIEGATNGDDVINGTIGNNVINGLDGDDELFGLAGDDILSGDDGDDIVAGGGGRDLVSGGDGDDDLRGGKGNDTLVGGDGDDRLRVGGDDDFGFGGNGNDFLQGAAGDDTLFGEDGDDVLYGGTGVDTLDGGNGNDELRAGSSGDRLDGGDGDDVLLSQSGDDFADGGAGDDLVNGAAGNDILLGGDGMDRLNGGTGNDRLDGGEGDDILNGQAGMDTFVFNASDTGSDTVIGYEVGETIELNGFGYANSEAAAADFSQVGNDVVFQNGDVSATFTNTTLFALFDGITVGDGDAGSASVDMARVDDSALDLATQFEVSLEDDASLF